MATTPIPVETGDVSAAPGELELIRQFVNSVELDPDVEELTDLDALRRWLRRRRLIGSRDQLADGDLERAVTRSRGASRAASSIATAARTAPRYAPSTTCPTAR